MKRIDIVKKEDEWIAHDSDGNVLVRGTTKAEVVKDTAKVATDDPEDVTVKIHKEDGTIEEERTYPRSADPSKSKG